MFVLFECILVGVMMWLVDVVGFVYVCLYGVGMICMMMVDGVVCLFVMVVVDMLLCVGFVCMFDVDVWVVIWEKVVFNVVFNMLCVMMGCIVD